MRVLVCGDRNWVDYEYIAKVLDELVLSDNDLIIEGDARGADRLAGLWAEENGVPHVRIMALWEKYGRAAGPIRNRKMLHEYRPELVIAFHDDIDHSKGTMDMITISNNAKVETRLYWHPIAGHVPPPRIYGSIR